MRIDLTQPKPPPPPLKPAQVVAPPRYRLLDTVLLIFLLFAVGYQTPIGKLPALFASHNESGFTWFTKLSGPRLNSNFALELPQASPFAAATLPANIQKAAKHLEIDPFFLSALAYTLGTCDPQDCQIPTPPYLSEVLGSLPTPPIVPIYTVAKGLKEASAQLYGNSELALEGLFLGVATVRRATHFAKIAGHAQAEHIEAHASFFPSHIPEATIATVETILANYRLWNLNWPVGGNHVISSHFGKRIHPVTQKAHLHNGIDIAAPSGTPVLAAQSGEVVRTGRDSLNGNYIQLSHGFGIQTYYCHLQSISVSRGTYLQKGQPIGAVGQTGRVTGPHLHFTLKLNNKAANPEDYSWSPTKQIPHASLLNKEPGS